jgi:DNA repair protein RadC
VDVQTYEDYEEFGHEEFTNHFHDLKNQILETPQNVRARVFEEISKPREYYIKALEDCHLMLLDLTELQKLING